MWSLFSNSLGNSYSSTAQVKALACVTVIEYVMEMLSIKQLDFIVVMFI